MPLKNDTLKEMYNWVIRETYTITLYEINISRQISSEIIEEVLEANVTENFESGLFITTGGIGVIFPLCAAAGNSVTIQMPDYFMDEIIPIKITSK